MAQSDGARIAQTILSEPHIRGRRSASAEIHALVEERGDDPAEVAERFDLDIADVYHALAYYHDHTEEMQSVDADRRDAIESIRESVNRPPGVEPPSADE
ncbi:MAG: DUF433 domain-containing protein [Natrialbaceae archaeon]|nr:DUF433 domain-containing protein [Natrialbaceae archaeon]